MMMAVASAPRITPYHCDRSVNPVQARLMYAAVSSPTNSRSPRVVTSGNNPRRGTVGGQISHTVMPTSSTAMPMKKIATGLVHAIHANALTSNPPHREALRDVVTHEPDHERARYQGQDACCRQRSPVQS